MKYELCEEKNINNRILRRIHYCNGSLGGWIEGEKNLDKYSNARVLGDACVYSNALVSGNACVFGNAYVYGDAFVFGNAHISGDAYVSGDDWETSSLQIQGSIYFFSISSKSHITVGCTTKTIAEWQETYEKKFIKNHFTEEQKKEYKLYFNLASTLYGWGLQLPL